MSFKFHKRSSKSGLPPGSLVYIGEQKLEEIKISVFEYDLNTCKESIFDNIDDCLTEIGPESVRWINIDGLHDTSIIEKLGAHFKIHSLVLEDILNTEKRPKREDYGDYIFLILKMFYCERESENDNLKNETLSNQEIKVEQVSLILGANFVITFQEDIGDIFDKIRERIRQGKGRLRKSGSDYLAYAIIDTIIDNYFSILEDLGEEIESLEQELVNKPSENTLARLHQLKREMLYLRRSIWPMREVISGLEREETQLIKDSTIVFLRDIYDHTIEVIDTIETFRDILSGMLDIYLSSVSNHMNSVMKVLTIIATIFMPLTFIAGVYGMNFKHMPELEWQYGYPAIMLFMFIIALGMLAFFRKKHWI